MVRWREVTSLKIKALTSYSATLFDLKNKKCILREGAKNILWWGCITSYPKVRWRHLQPKALRFCPPSSHGDVFDSFPYETTPYRTNCWVTTYFLQNGTTKNLACEDLSDLIKKMGIASTSIKWYIVVESIPSILH